jgi:hypothetical protein
MEEQLSPKQCVGGSNPSRPATFFRIRKEKAKVLVVKVEVWPGGIFSRAFEVSRVGIANVSDLARHSDYEVTALMSRDRDERVVRTKIRSHDRELGWVPLVQRSMTGIFLMDKTGHEVPYGDPVAELLRKGSRV